MRSLQRIGGVCAHIAAGTFIVGLVMFVTVVSDYATATEANEAIAFLVDHQLALYVWNIVISIVFGVALVPLVLALHARLSHAGSALTSVATTFGVIWSGVIIAAGMITNIGYGTVVDLQETDPVMAETVWTALDSVQNGLGGGNEVVGALWVIGVSVVALRARVMPRWIHGLGIIMGAAGLLTVVPALEDVGAVFGLGLVVWFTAVGMKLLRDARTLPEAAFATQNP